MIKFKCASCDKAYQLPDNAAGRKARCKACGEAMTVPDAPDELFDDSPSMGADLTKLYATSGDSGSSDVVDQSAVVDDPVAFNPEVGFQQQAKKPASSGTPKIFILAGVGGALALVVIVVVVFVVLSGKEDGDSNDSDGGLAFDTSAAVPVGEVPMPTPGSNTTPGTDPQPPIDEPEVLSPDPDVEGGNPEAPAAVDPDEPEVGSPNVDGPVDRDATPATSPNASNYAIMLPDGLDLISQTRVAVRTAPQADGTWLSMEVHKLAEPDQREASPLAADGSTVLLRGRRVAVPDGVEVSDFATNNYSAKRLLHPKQSNAKTRRVEYVIKDGPYLISVLGRFPADDEARLAMLDEAAKSVQPVKGD